MSETPLPGTYPLIESIGDRCLMIRFGTKIDPDTTRQIHAFTHEMVTHPLAGVVDVVPAFTAVALHFRAAPDAGMATLSALGAAVHARIAAGLPTLEDVSRVVDVPVCYGGDHGPDLDAVAAHCGLSADAVIELHATTPVSVLTFFFSPGNPFAGPIDPRLRIPRRTTPRERVLAGSVAIANDLTSIYQVASPGGWNLIGRTPWSMFDLGWQPPTRLRLGDRLRFTPITPTQFDEMDERR